MKLSFNGGITLLQVSAHFLAVTAFFHTSNKTNAIHSSQLSDGEVFFLILPIPDISLLQAVGEGRLSYS